MGGFTAGLLSSGNFNSALKSAAGGAISGGIFGGVNGYFGDTWNLQRVAANSIAGGISAELQGGRFADGFKANFTASSARLSLEYAREYTDNLKLKSASQSDGRDTAEYNSRGDLLTAGVRPSELAPGAQSYEISRLMKALSMGPEGSSGHMFGADSFAGIFTNQVSKVHDLLNSWNYNPETGRYISRGQVFDTAFDVLWSFPGMPVAAAYTAIAMSTDINHYLNNTALRSAVR